MSPGQNPPVRQRSPFARLLATFLISALSLVGLGAVAQTAAAQTPGVSSTVLHNGSPIQDGAVVQSGDTLTVNTQYNVNTPDGAAVTIGIPVGVTLDESSLELPPGNTAIESITQVGDGIQIQFHDPIPDIQDGIHSLEFTFDEVEHTGSQTLEWQVDGETVTWEITNVRPGDEEENVSNWLNKDVGWTDLNQYVSVDNGGNVVLDEAVTDHAINYTLNVNTDGDTDRSSFSIADEISEYLAYNDDFSASITTWDEDGWNQETNDFDFSPMIDGNSFVADVDIPSPSQLEITYSASVSESELDNLRDALQAAYEELDGDYGDFNVALGNAADFGGESREATTNVGGSIDEPAPAPVPNPGQAFGKSSSTGNQDIELDEDDDLVEPIDVTYTLTADLSQWDGEAEDGYDNHEDFVLDRNVVISDNLPSAGIWNTGADDFITADGIELAPAADFDGDAAAFGHDDYVGRYAVVGQNLFINIGQETETSVEIDVRALITSIEGLWPWEGAYGAIHYAFENDGAFHYRDGEPYTDSHRFDLIDRGDTSGGIQDPNRFSKNAQGDDTIYVAPGDPVTLDYEFIVDGVDVTNSYIVDYRDPNVFDLSDLEEIREEISGQYAHWRDLTSDHFDVSVNENGNLVIQLSEAGIDQINEWDQGTDARLVVNIPLTTVPLDGRQTIQVENSATLFGEDDEALYWSETTSEASSFGNESEVRKTVRDTPNAEWTQNLRAEIVDGELVQDTYVYNLAYIPHGTFGGVPVTSAVDELPVNLEFLGFVTADNVDSGDNPEPGPVDIGGNLEAVYDADAHTVTVQQQAGTVLVQEPDISANVLVQITEFTADVPIVNMLERSTTTITPSDGYPLSIAKVDSEDDEVVINDPDSRFQILDADENVVVEDAFVEDGFLRVLDEDGDSRGIVVSQPGTYYVEETVAPEGYELSTDRIQVVVDEDGNSSQVTFPNVPTDEPEPTEGDFSVVKAIEDSDDVLEGVDTAELEFTVAYSYEDADGESVTETLTVVGDGEAVDSATLPAGTEVALSEVNLPEVEGAEWGEPVFDPETVTIADGDTVEVTLTNTIASVEEPQPGVGIIKGDGDAEEGTIENDANTEEEAVAYEAGETREIVINVTNTGDEDLVDVVLTDETLSGADIEGLVWTLPDGETTIEAEDVDGVLTATWDGPWAPEQVITGVATLTLAEGEDLHTNVASVTAQGAASGQTVEDEDPYNATPPEPEPVDPTYAVGDYVWIDANNDGIQDDDEDPLPGVTVELYGVDEEGNRSTEPIATTVTDEDGRYIFDELPAGDYEIRFILTDEQAALYEFTQHHAGDDAGADSNADPETGWTIRFTLDDANEALTLDYTDQPFSATQGIDPTWDAGVVLRSEVPVEEEPPAEEEEPPAAEDPSAAEDLADGADQLPRAGAGIGLWALVLAGLLALTGGTLALISRSARSRN